MPCNMNEVSKNKLLPKMTNPECSGALYSANNSHSCSELESSWIFGRRGIKDGTWTHHEAVWQCFFLKKKISTIEVIQKTRTQGKPRSKLLFCYLASSASAQGKKVWRKVRKRACFKAECSRTPTFILLWLLAFADSAFIIKKFHRRKPVSVAACVPASIICIWLETRWH